MMDSPAYMYTIACFMIVQQQSSVNGELLSRPKDTDVLIGEDVHLCCRTNLSEPVRWSHTAVGKNGSRSVTWGSGEVVQSYKDRYSVQSSHGYMNLTIRDVQPKDAGLYSCADLGGYGIDTGEHGSANLIVLDKKMKCSYQPENMTITNCPDSDNITITCVVGYSGNVEPSLKWKQKECSGNVSVENTTDDNSKEDQDLERFGNVKNTTDIKFGSVTRSSKSVSGNAMKVGSKQLCSVSRLSARTPDSPGCDTLTWISSPTVPCPTGDSGVGSVATTKQLDYFENFRPSTEAERKISTSLMDREWIMSQVSAITVKFTIINIVFILNVILVIVYTWKPIRRCATCWCRKRRTKWQETDVEDPSVGEVSPLNTYTNELTPEMKMSQTSTK